MSASATATRLASAQQRQQQQQQSQAIATDTANTQSNITSAANCQLSNIITNLGEQYQTSQQTVAHQEKTIGSLNSDVEAYKMQVTNLGARNSGLQDKLEQFAGVDLRVMEESQFLKKKTDLLANTIMETQVLIGSESDLSKFMTQLQKMMDKGTEKLQKMEEGFNQRKEEFSQGIDAERKIQENLREKLEALEENCKELTAEIKTNIGTIDDLKSDSVALTEKMKAQTEEADTTAMQLAEKNKHELQTAKSRIQQLESEAAEAGTKLSALEKQHDELSSTHAASTKQLSELQLTLTAATDATKKEEEEKQQLVAVAKQELEKYELLQKQHVDLQTTHGASVKSATELKDELDAATKDAKQKEEQIAQLLTVSEQFNVLEKTHKELTLANSAMETKLAASENDATEKEELNQKLISEAKKEAEKFEAQEAKLNEAILQLKTSSEMVETLEQAATESSAQGGKTEKAVKAEIKSLKGKNTSLEKKHTKLTEEKKQLQADNGELQEVIETKNNELASKDKELESMAESTTELAKNLTEKSAEAKDLVERNKSLDEDKTQQLNANEYTVSNLKEQLETAKKGLGIVNAEVAGLKASQEASAQTAGHLQAEAEASRQDTAQAVSQALAEAHQQNNGTIEGLHAEKLQLETNLAGQAKLLQNAETEIAALKQAAATAVAAVAAIEAEKAAMMLQPAAPAKISPTTSKTPSSTYLASNTATPKPTFKSPTAMMIDTSNTNTRQLNSGGGRNSSKAKTVKAKSSTKSKAGASAYSKSGSNSGTAKTSSPSKRSMSKGSSKTSSPSKRSKASSKAKKGSSSSIRSNSSSTPSSYNRSNISGTPRVSTAYSRNARSTPRASSQRRAPQSAMAMSSVARSYDTGAGGKDPYAFASDSDDGRSHGMVLNAISNTHSNSKLSMQGSGSASRRMQKQPCKPKARAAQKFSSSKKKQQPKKVAAAPTDTEGEQTDAGDIFD